jgi:peptidoglycan hydrolase-like protein with peptidoglycan-binding domain
MRNIVIAGMLAVVMIVSTAAPASALTADEIQVQIRELLQKVTDLTKQLNELRGQQANPVPPSIIGSAMPGKHRICYLLTRDLTPGAQGDDVRGLQEFLYEHKFLAVNPTGYFGQMTADAVKRWQSGEGVIAAGAFGPLSRERIKIWCGGDQSPNKERFSAAPMRGEAPLTVTFDTWLSGFRVPSIYYAIDFGDGSQERAADCPAPADACTGPGQNAHTYTQNGSYTATLTRITDPCMGQVACRAAIQSEIVGKVQVQVGQMACTKEYRPVCGSKPVVCITAPCNPVPTTYSNKCMMAADGASYLYEGQCRSDYQNPADNPSCKAWYDGCNSCARESASSPAACTLKYCAVPEKPYCTAYFDSSGNKPPTISGFSGPTTLNVNSSGTWSVNASDPEGGSLSYQIWWGDEKTFAAHPNASLGLDFVQSTTFTHAYATAGTYTVIITVKDSAGQQAKTSTTVKVGGDVACTMQYDPVC